MFEIDLTNKDDKEFWFFFKVLSGINWSYAGSILLSWKFICPFSWSILDGNLKLQKA